MNRKTIVKLIIGFALSILCLYFALKGIHFSELFKIIMTTSIPGLILIVVLMIAAVFLRAFMYYPLLKRKLSTVSFFSIFESIMIGYMVNSIVPLRAGDIVKAYIIGKTNGISKTYVLTLAVIERLFDMITLLISFILLLLTIRLDGRYTMAAKAVAVMVMAGLVVIIAALACGKRMPALVDRVFFFASHKIRDLIKGTFATVQSGLAILCDIKDVFFIQVLFLAIWGLYVLTSYVAGLAVGIPMTLPMALSLVVTISFGSVIVSSPGQMGVHQYASVIALSYFGISREGALSFSLIQNTLSVVLPIVLGWIFLLHMNLSLASVTSSAQAPEPEAAPPAGA